MRCVDCEYDKKCSIQELEEDITGCEGHSKSRQLKYGQCMCYCCKKIFNIGDKRIFEKTDNPKLGLCFDCY